ncbi:plexin domain-containing protein 2-like [Centruroides vittatus]|uniref:plexin domain-containing protein 2-like n=1 Tax=Centruroides vittatus TaxID=120091 RepID=UPI003510CF0B
MESAIGCLNCLFSVFLFTVLICLQNIYINADDLIKAIENNGTVFDFPDFDATEPPNLENRTDHHTYYNSTLYTTKAVADSFWINLDKKPDAITHRMLSESHRRAAAVQLSFPFPFYGHFLNNITIATGGFLYTGDHIHSWIAATQYIAPLMANFDPSISNTSLIRYYDNGTAFTVLWDNVILKEKASEVGGGGSFKFETILYKNGDIAFVYKNIPFPITEISNESHPVKIGISDAYVLERTSYFFRKKIIYEYHKTDLKHLDISNDTILYFKALPTCLKFKDCVSCESSQIGFDCIWCETNKKCSDGLDRNRQEWLQFNCISHKNQSACPKGVEMTPSTVTTSETSSSMDTSTVVPKISNPTTLVSTSNPPETSSSSDISQTISSKSPSSTAVTWSSFSSLRPPEDHNTIPSVYDGMKASSKVSLEESKETGIGAGGVFAIILVIVLIIGVGIWLFYAYKHPHSSSGQFLIKYRPSQWHWKSEESRYSASVHM